MFINTFDQYVVFCKPFNFDEYNRRNL